jgi:hypothetical protein
VLEDDEFLPYISLIEINGKVDFTLNKPLKNIRQYQEAKPKSATIQFILGLFPSNKQVAVNEVIDKAIEATRLGQAEIALQIIAKLMNVTAASNKI